jgi:hypothetical protein
MKRFRYLFRWRHGAPGTRAAGLWLPAMALTVAAMLAGEVQAAGVPKAGAVMGEAWSLCAREIARAEREMSIPRDLLAAISQIEAGRWNEQAKARLAWPWTVMAEGRGRYLATKAAAVAEVRQLLKRGVRNIDVGCLQVNLKHHPDAFGSLDAAFDPATNVSYGAGFLRSLQLKLQSWVRAVGNYHSATPSRHRSYRAKVFAVWREERGQAGVPAALAPPPPLSDLDFGRVGPVSVGEAS